MRRSLRLWITGAAMCALSAAILATGAMAAPTQQTGALVQTATNATYGTILVNSQGMTLYTLSSEAGGTITCTGSCLGAWPPLLLPAGTTTPTTGTGVTGTVGVVSRTDGTMQVTFNGFPLYTFSGDSAAGQTNGQGVVSFGGTWHIAQPSATTTGPTATPTSPSTTVPTGGPLVHFAFNSVLGGLVVNSAGMTLYYNTAEEGSKIVCTAKCLGVWPPLQPSGTGTPTAGTGITGNMGVITRSDGTQQVTYNGVPLYTFIKDTAPGQTNGEGIKAFGGVWHAAQVFGTPLAATLIPTVPLTIHITKTGTTVWGTVKLHYKVASVVVNKSCSVPPCVFPIPTGATVHFTQVPLNAATWPFSKWKAKTAGNPATTSTSTSLKVKMSSATNVTAVYVLAH